MRVCFDRSMSSSWWWRCSRWWSTPPPWNPTRPGWVVSGEGCHSGRLACRTVDACSESVCVCVCLCLGGGDQFCVRIKIICTITAFASFLNFQKPHLTSLFIWFSLLLNPIRPIFLSFRFYFGPYRCCLFSSFYDSSMCTTQCDIAFFYFFITAFLTFCCCAGIVYRLPWKRYSTQMPRRFKDGKLEKRNTLPPPIFPFPVGCICSIISLDSCSTICFRAGQHILQYVGACFLRNHSDFGPTPPLKKTPTTLN